jgi:disulfide bond formation protein DsbB
MRNFTTARLLALLFPAVLVGGALISQYVFGLHPCEMCMWQRWPHYAAIVLAILAFLLGQKPAARVLVALAAVLVIASGVIGIFHAGVEYSWWEGLTRCASAGPMTLDDIMNAPLIRCDVAPWTLFGVSLAGFNALFSIVGGGVILSLLRRSKVTA